MAFTRCTSLQCTRSAPAITPAKASRHRSQSTTQVRDLFLVAALIKEAKRSRCSKTKSGGGSGVGGAALSEPIENYFAWVEDGGDGREGIIATVVPGVPSGEPTSLQGRSYEFVLKLRPLAEQHAMVSGHKVRLVRFRRDQVLEDISP